MIPSNQNIKVVDNRGVETDNWGMRPAKAMTIRLSADQAEQLETVANVDQRPVAEIIRAAIAEHIDRRKEDSQFQDSLKDRITRAQQLLGTGGPNSGRP
jgi:predicted transcriptional regulator